MLQKAIEIAVAAHAGQKRKNNLLPYITHPLGVMGILMDYGYDDEELLCAAVLHDVIEDCNPVFAEAIERMFPNVYIMVQGLTKEYHRKDTCAKLASQPKEVQIVKCADILHNISGGEIYPTYFEKKRLQMEAMEKVRGQRLAADINVILKNRT